MGSPLIEDQLNCVPPVTFKVVPTPSHIISSSPAYVLLSTFITIETELTPTMGQALSLAFTVIVEKLLLFGVTIKQKLAVAKPFVNVF